MSHELSISIKLQETPNYPMVAMITRGSNSLEIYPTFSESQNTIIGRLRILDDELPSFLETTIIYTIFLLTIPLEGRFS